MVNLCIIGPNGQMGRAMTRLAALRKNVALAAAVGPKGRAYVGADLGDVAGVGKKLGIPVGDNLRQVIHECHVVADCTAPEVSMEMLDVCVKHKTAFVTGTTGFTDGQKQKIDAAGEKIPVIRAANTSKVIHILMDLLKQAVAMAGHQAQIDIMDYHGRSKPDAPSGTALELGELSAKKLGLAFPQCARFTAEQGPRPDGLIRFSSVRSGNIPSTHQVVLGFENERLELWHHAYNMDAFAGGMVDAAVFLADKPPELYDLHDALTTGAKSEES